MLYAALMALGAARKDSHVVVPRTVAHSPTVYAVNWAVARRGAFAIKPN